MTYSNEPCIGLLEFSSIARGIEASDRILKEASVRVLFARPVSPGKYLILFTGSVDDVIAAHAAGRRETDDVLVDQLLLTAVHDGVLTALQRPPRISELDAVGVLETATAASTLIAADTAAKRASVDLMEVHLARGIGGKSYVTLTGPVGDVEDAIEVAAAGASATGHLLYQVVIAQPHPEMLDILSRHHEEI